MPWYAILASGPVTMDHPVVVFASVMLILLAAPLLFERLRIPGMVGLITAGIVLGPNGLRLFADDATFRLLGTVGLLYLMFLAGLETNAADFRANRSGSLVFGALTFAIPMGMGTLLVRPVLPHFSWTQAILLASMFASHTLLTHPIASRLGLARHRTVVTTVGGTILTDTAALMVLAIIAEFSRTAPTPWFLVRQLGLLTLLVVIVLRGLPPLGYWFFRRMEPDGNAEFIFVLALVFLSALGALLTGVEAIIGAFLAGIAFSSLVPEQGVLRNRLEFAGHALFIPFFLLRVGMLVDPSAFISGWHVLRVSAFMTATVLVTKGLAAHATARLRGFGTDEAWLVFGLSVNQAAATLAAVLVGCEIGLFDDTILNGTIAMMLVSCLLGPWVTERYGRRVAEGQQRTEARWSPHPDRILVAVGSPASAERVLDLALLLAPAKAARLHALHVVPEGPGEEQGIAEADRVLAAAIVRGSAGGIVVEGMARIAPSPAQGIVRAARESRASIVVLGWAEHNAARLFLFRSLLERVLSDARGQTVVVGRWPFSVGTSRRIWAVVPPLVERQEGLPEGLGSLCTVARRAGAGLHLAVSSSGAGLVEPLLAKIADKPAPHIRTYSRWEDVLPLLKGELQAGDLLAVLGARKTQAGWDAALERFPSVLARTFPNHNLLAVFPPVSTDDARSLPSPFPARDQVREQRVRLRERCLATALLGWQGPLAEAVGILLDQAYGPVPGLAALKPALLRNGPVELVPGVLLLHTHANGVGEATVLLASGRVDLPTPEPSAARILLCLVSPYSDPPEVHLAILAELVRLVQRPGLVDAVASASDRATLGERLMQLT